MGRKLCLIAVVGLMSTLAVYAGVDARVASAGVVTGQPWQADVCYTSACVWSPTQGAYVAGGDGVSIEAYIESLQWDPNVTNIINKARNIEEVALEEIPEYRLVPGLGQIVLAATTFQVGWKIGSTINTKWLHLAGVGVGKTLPPTAPCSGGSGLMLGKWVGTTDGVPGFAPTYGPRGPGWYFKATDTVCNAGNRVEWTPDIQCTGSNGTCTQDQIDRRQGAQWVAGFGGTWAQDTSRACGFPFGCFYFRWMDEAAMHRALAQDQPLQPYTSQPWGVSTGWPVPGGCGIAFNACAFPGSQTNPAPSLPHIRCQLSGDAADCGTGTPHICVPADGTGLYGGAGSTGCGLGEGAKNDLNCHADPSDFACPSTTGDGSAFGSSGGYNGGGDGITTVGGGECKFRNEDGGREEWNLRNVDGAYDAECSEAWSIAENQGWTDSLGNPTSLLKSVAKRLIRGDKLGNETVTDAMLQKDPGSSLTDWYKVKSPDFTTSEGHSASLHFYLNVADGTVLIEEDYFVVFANLF